MKTVLYSLATLIFTSLLSGFAHSEVLYPPNDSDGIRVYYGHVAGNGTLNQSNLAPGSASRTSQGRYVINLGHPLASRSHPLASRSQ